MNNICSYKNICIYSSLFYLITTIIAFINKNYIFGFIALFLTVTSLMVHSCRTEYTLSIDEIFVYIIVIYSFYFLYKKFCKKSCKKIIDLRICILLCFIFATFFITIYLYYYGYYSYQFSFDKDMNTARLYHFFLHFISAYGLSLINIL